MNAELTNIEVTVINICSVFSILQLFQQTKLKIKLKLLRMQIKIKYYIFFHIIRVK